MTVTKRVFLIIRAYMLLGTSHKLNFMSYQTYTSVCEVLPLGSLEQKNKWMFLFT